MKFIFTVNNNWTPSTFIQLKQQGVYCFRVNGIHISDEMLYILERIHDNQIELYYDLPGTKCRIWTGSHEKEKVEFGDIITINREYMAKERFYITGESLWENEKVGNTLLVRRVNKEPVRMMIKEKTVKSIKVKVMSEGIIGNGYHVFNPLHYWGNRYLSADDINQISRVERLAPENIAVSFADTVAIIEEARSFYGTDKKYYAKIESPEAVANIDSIIEASDGIIIGRDDLSAYLSKEDIEGVIDTALTKCYLSGKPCIGASNYLQSIYDTGIYTMKDLDDYRRLKKGNADGIYVNETNKDIYWEKYLDALREFDRLLKIEE